MLLVWLRLFGHSRRFFFTAVLNLGDGPGNRRLAYLAVPQLGQFTLGFIAMLLDKLAKLLQILDLESLLRHGSGFRFDLPRLGLALTPQVNCVATNVEQLAGLTFLESIQLDGLHHFLPKVIAVRSSHSRGKMHQDFSSLRPNLSACSYITWKNA